MHCAEALNQRRYSIVVTCQFKSEAERQALFGLGMDPGRDILFG